MKNIPIGEVLKEYGYIDDEQLALALQAQKKDSSKRLGEHLIALGFIEEPQMLKALSDKLNQPVIDLDKVNVETQAVAKIPKMLALKYTMLAFSEQNGHLNIVTSDPLNFYGIEDIRLVTGMEIRVSLCEKARIVSAIEYHYAEIKAQEAAHAANDTSTSFVTEEELFNAQDDDTPVVKLFSSLLIRGYNANASDIHIEPCEDKTMIRMRIDGMIVDYVQLAKNLHQSLLVRVKIMSNMDIAEKRLPQDGHFITTLNSYKLNLRVSIVPTVYGEKCVLRFLNTNTTILHNQQFGMNLSNYQKVSKMLQMPHGIIYLSGPTGSGKSTTLYMILEALAKKQINIMTIEDPVEKNIDRTNQMQINTAAGLTFESGLRSLLRQDPDVIMVGETRDEETASISVRAAITGHLVLSSLHTNDAISTILRLEDMGVQPYLVANSLVGSVSQRLVRLICPHCKTRIATSEEQRAILGQKVETMHYGSGCPHCNQTGYKGRMAVHEIIIMDKEMRKMVSEQATMDELTAYVKKVQDMKSLKEETIELVKQGLTTIEELYKITAYSD